MTVIWTSRITIFYDSSYEQEKAISTKDGACQGAYSLKSCSISKLLRSQTIKLWSYERSTYPGKKLSSDLAKAKKIYSNRAAKRYPATQLYPIQKSSNSDVQPSSCPNIRLSSNFMKWTVGVTTAIWLTTAINDQAIKPPQQSNLQRYSAIQLLTIQLKNISSYSAVNTLRHKDIQLSSYYSYPAIQLNS